MKFIFDQGERGGGGWGVAGMVSPRESVVQSACQYDVTSRVGEFQMANKVFIEEMDENFEFITAMLFQFLGSRHFKIAIVIERQT